MSHSGKQLYLHWDIIQAKRYQIAFYIGLRTTVAFVRGTHRATGQAVFYNKNLSSAIQQENQAEH